MKDRQSFSNAKIIFKQFSGRICRPIIASYFRSSEVDIILMYHRVLKQPPAVLHDPSLFVTKSTFEMHLRELDRYFEISPLEALLERNETGRSRCAITFDDGWVDNYEVAFPLLKEHKVPATIFVSPALIGTDHWFWWESLYHLAEKATMNGSQSDLTGYFSKITPSLNTTSLPSVSIRDVTEALKSLPGDKLNRIISDAYLMLGAQAPAGKKIMDWDQVREMSQHNVTFGSHGLSHYILTELDRDSKRREICESIELLKSRGLSLSPFFSLPNGRSDLETVELLIAAGYIGAVTRRLGCTGAQANKFLINRIGVHEFISNTPGLLWFRILQAVYAHSREGKSGHSIRQY